MKQTMRFLSLLMVLVLCVSLAPVSAFASGEIEERAFVKKCRLAGDHVIFCFC